MITIKTRRIARWTMVGVCGMVFSTSLALGQEGGRRERNRPATRPAMRDGQRPGAGAMAQRLRQLVDELDLTADQKDQVHAIFDKAEADLKSLQAEWQKTPPEPQQRMEKLRGLMQQARTDVLALLTDTQKEQLRQKMQQRGATTQPGAAGRPALAALREAVAQLDLSPEQKEQLKTYWQEQQGKIQELRQQAANGAGDAREKIRGLMDDARQKLQEVLTPEQLQKLRELMQEKMGQFRGDGAAAKGGN